MGTIRQQIIALLERQPMDVVAISQALGIREKETVIHLPHIAKSVAGRGGRLRVRPARCEGCGYEFKDRRRLSPPSRCPRCKTSRIQGPWYEVSQNR
ncbi:MAG: transcriptional regulator [Desulfobacteraceae bacterium]|nr:MAG: transcriptional regulator [Desulfobacteraceae bacterium]